MAGDSRRWIEWMDRSEETHAVAREDVAPVLPPLLVQELA